MSVVSPILPKLVERDSYDEDLTDIDDEVFIRDGKNKLKLNDDGGVKRPLMASHRKYKKSYNFKTYGFLNKAGSGFIALIILLSLIILCIYIINIIPGPMSILKNWLSHNLKDSLHESNLIPCTSLTSKILWTKSLPKLTSESPIRSNDVNDDGIEDIIIGFSTGLDIMNIPEYACTSYFNGQVPCFGGVLALNGKTGDILWIHWTAHAIFSIDCGLDLTNDKIKDCIICGRNGILHAVNGYNGTSIWEIPVRDLSISEEWKFSDIYDARFIADINGDDVGDIIASHIIHSSKIHTSEILIISGINGNIIHNSVLPNTEQLFLAPQKLIHPDGENIFILVTSSQKQSSGLYIISQVNLIYGNLKLRKLHHDTGKGTLLPPILVDVTLDGIEDIVAAMFNSTIIVYNGLTFEPIWNYTVPNSEVISIPIPGYYNDDNIPDFMVKHQIGFPTYYYTVATIIDGKTGKPLLEKPIEDSLSREMSGLSITVEGFGNDWFLHWSVDCLNYEGIKEKYQFLKNEDFISESHADLCKLRFNSTLITKLYALSQHVGPPGISLYFSEDWKFLEYNNSLNTRIELHENIPFVPEQLSKIYKDYKENFKQKQKDYYEQHMEYKKFANNQNNILKNENKWIQNNIQTKDYDVLYNENNKINLQEEPIDYQQEENKDREQRSNSNLDFKFINQQLSDNKINDSVKNMLKNISYKTNKFETFNIAHFLNIKKNRNVDENNKILNKKINYDVNKTKEIKSMDVKTYAYKFSNIRMTEDAIIKNFKQKKLIKNRLKKKEINFKSKLELEHKYEIKLKKQKKKREIKTKNNQIHSIHGVQKQPPSGILLPSISESKGITSIDLVFSTFWLPSTETPIILIQEDLNCIHWKKILSEKKLQYKQNDDIIEECLNERGINYKTYQEANNKENFKISLGQMTIYRMKLECMCPEDMLPNQTCKNISLHQSWSEYLESSYPAYNDKQKFQNFKQKMSDIQKTCVDNICQKNLFICKTKERNLKYNLKEQYSNSVKKQNWIAEFKIMAGHHKSNKIGYCNNLKCFRRPVVPFLVSKTQNINIPIRFNHDILNDILINAQKQCYAFSSKSETFKNVGTQTDYRDSEAQTIPWEPSYKIKLGHNPEVLSIVHLTWNHGLQIGNHELEIINRIRKKRAWEAILPPMDTPANIKRRTAIINALEVDEWAFRESEIQAIMDYRLELMNEISKSCEYEKQKKIQDRLDRLTNLLSLRRDKEINSIEHKLRRELRKLHKKHQEKSQPLKRDIIKEHANPSSELYAPQMRYGEHPQRRHEIIEKELLGESFIENVTEINTLPKWLPTYEQLSAIEPKPKSDDLCIRATRWTKEKLIQLHSDLKAIRLSTIYVTIDAPVLLKRKYKMPSLPPTPYKTTIEDIANIRLHQLSTLIQKIVRGRAIQCMMFEGRNRCRELIEELQSSYGLEEYSKKQNQKEKQHTLELQELQNQKSLQDDRLCEILNSLEGMTISGMLDFLTKELIRLEDERQIHAFALLAERKRAIREAAEAGKRQLEYNRRREFDEIFKQIIKINQDSVETYLEDIIKEGIEWVSDEATKAYISELCDTIDNVSKVARDNETKLAEEEMIANMIYNFVLPEIEKTTLRKNIREKQQVYLQNAHAVIYNKILNLSSVEDKN